MALGYWATLVHGGWEKRDLGHWVVLAYGG